jgi:uncharacterized membrane protein YjjP (DUF1212 family)
VTTQPLPERRQADPSALADLLVRLGRMLLEYGCPTHRLEIVLRYTAERHGCEAEVFGVPTGLWMSLQRPGQEPIIRLVRVQRWAIRLDRLAELDQAFNAVADGHLTLEDARLWLDALEEAPPRYGAGSTLLAGAMASASAAVVFGGGLLMALLGFSLGLLSGAASWYLGRNLRTRLLIDFVAGCFVGAVAWVAAIIAPELPRKPLVLAGIILYVPGLTLTSGLAEVAFKNLVAGAGRLLDATMTFLSLLFGVAALATLEQAVHPDHAVALITATGGTPTPLWALALATMVTGLAFGVLFSVARRDLPLALLSAVLAWGASLLTSRYGLSGPTAAFVGALVCGMHANLFARITDRPAQVVLVPGIVMLVPGTFGFVSFEQMVWGNIMQGTVGMVQTMLVSGALVIGLLLANAALPARKIM